jgi:murein DD-endopeptidase MepM/ murein hydrolase activator NlpD
MNLKCSPFAPGERYDMMWGCCSGTHASSTWQNNGNDYYAGAGTVCVAPIDGEVIRAGVPGIGQGERVGIQGATHSVYMAHMTNLRVRQGDRVSAGDPVGVIWDWGGAGMPPHLHFSLAKGSYGGGSFVDPWSEVVALSVHVSGRTYQAPKAGSPVVKPPPKPVEPQHFVEDMPNKFGGHGPDVYGPWANTPAHEANRAELVTRMRANGKLAVPMNDHLGDLYIYVYVKGTYGDPFRFGPWSTPEGAEKAQTILVSSGRVIKPRRFKGKANSLYPWL